MYSIHSQGSSAEWVSISTAQEARARACARSLEGRRFTSAFLADSNLEDRSLQYVNTGHNAPVLRRASGAWVRLEHGGLPLGVDPGGHQGSSPDGP